MSALLCYLNSTVGRKYIMALTGLALSGFVFTHMAANMLIFVGARAYNGYGHALTTNPFFPLISGGLLACFLLHAAMGILLSKQNRAARGENAYAMSADDAGKATPVSSKTMIFSGSLVLFFLVTHLLSFKWGTFYSVTYGGVEMRDLHRLIIEKFQSPFYVYGYLICLVVLGFHLKHGFAALFQSLGLNHPRYTPIIKKTSIVYTLVVILGFISQPIYVYFFYRG